MSYTTRYTCRICGDSCLIPLFSLGTQYVSDFVKKGQERRGEPVPIDLELCQNCTLVQQKHTAPQEFLYTKHYWYRSGVTATMQKALRDITRSVERLIPLGKGDIVLDIGSNDGTLLRSYTTQGVIRVGVEPATNLAAEGSEGVQHFIPEFWSRDAYRRAVSKQAKVVSAIGMFYDLEDPNQFIADVEAVLANEGVFIAQLMCLKNMLNLGDVGNLAHEHLEFYSFRSLELLFGQHGLEIFDIETNDVNGESYRIYARKVGSRVHTKTGSSERVANVKTWEAELTERGTYNDFFWRIENNKQRTVDFIRRQRDRGYRVWVYGASTKGNVLLQYYGLDSALIEGAADRSPEKWGKVTIGTGIPIYKETYARRMNPDFFLVLPYTFLTEFLVRERRWRSDGGRFIVPLPYFEVV